MDATGKTCKLMKLDAVVAGWYKEPGYVAKLNKTHPVSRSHMLVKQSHILRTVSQDILRGRSEHVLHDLRSQPSLIIKVFLGNRAQGKLYNSHKVNVKFKLQYTKINAM